MSQLKNILLLVIMLNFANCRLVQVVQIFRHGARFPLSSDYDGQSQVVDWGELLPSGMRQHYNLGRQLRKEYIEDQQLLSPTFNHTEFYIRSTDVNRTIMSAQSQIMGMFPNGPQLPQLDSAQLLPPYFNTTNYLEGQEALPQFFQPIPIHIEPQDYSVLEADCIGENDLRNQDINDLQAIISDFGVSSTQMRGIICGYFNVTTECDVANVGRLYGVYISDVYQGKVVPQLTEEELHAFELISSFNFYYQYAGQQYSKYISQPFFKDVFRHLSNKIANPESALKWVSYSAHDSNVIIYARTLNFSSAECLYQTLKGNNNQTCFMQPQYATNIIFELHQVISTTLKDEQYYIKVKYNGVYQNICGDTNMCSYAQFQQVVEGSLATQEQFNQVCSGSGLKSQYETFLHNFEQAQSPMSFTTFFIIMQFILIAALSTYIIVTRKSRNFKQNYHQMDQSNLIIL